MLLEKAELKVVDKEIFDAIEMEKLRQQSNLEMIASENHTSVAVMEAMGSVMTNKYAEGYPAHRYYGGCQCVDIAERNCSEPNMPMCSPIPAPRPTWLFILPC